MTWLKYRLDIRIVVAATILVFAIPILIPILARHSVNQAEMSVAITPSIEATIQRLLTQYRIEEKSIRIRKVQSGGGKFVRLERKISVTSEFNTLSFNRDLHQAVAGLGATVIATEKAEDKSVTMHVKKNGVILQSVVFVVMKE